MCGGGTGLWKGRDPGLAPLPRGRPLCSIGTESVLPRMGSQAPREVAHLVPERRGSSCDWGGAGPAPQLGIREAWRPHRGSGLRPRSPATCIPNPQAVLMGGRCFHSGCFWRAAVASLAAPRAEARAHTGPPRAPLALGRCAGGGGGGPVLGWHFLFFSLCSYQTAYVSARLHGALWRRGRGARPPRGGLTR